MSRKRVTNPLGKKIRISKNTILNLSNTVDSKEISKMYDNAVKLKPEWCNCKRPGFLFYANDNVCVCGIKKHHVHCSTCGAISQVG